MRVRPWETVAARLARLKHLWADAGYRGQLVAWIKEYLSWSVEVVLPAPLGDVIPRVSSHRPCLRLRCSNAAGWSSALLFGSLGNYRPLSKDYEFLPATEENFIYLAMSRLMLRRLCQPGK